MSVASFKRHPLTNSGPKYFETKLASLWWVCLLCNILFFIDWNLWTNCCSDVSFLGYTIYIKIIPLIKPIKAINNKLSRTNSESINTKFKARASHLLSCIKFLSCGHVANWKRYISTSSRIFITRLWWAET